MVRSGDGLQGDRASSVGSPHVVLGGRAFAKVDELSKVSRGEGQQKDRNGHTCTETSSLCLKSERCQYQIWVEEGSRLTAVKPEDPDKTPVLPLETLELSGTLEDVLFPLPPRVRVLVVTFSQVYESNGFQAEGSTILTSAHCQKVWFLAPV